jgi:MFS family permease
MGVVGEATASKASENGGQDQDFATANNENHERGRGHVHSVLLASALHIDVDEEAFAVLPARHQGGVKSGLGWYGTLCCAGIGMFIEAYVIITTGQIKTIWHQQYPACLFGGGCCDVKCPPQNQCDPLFANDPFADDEGFCDANGNYPENTQCSNALRSSMSWSEFAGIMLGMLAFGYIADCLGRKHAGILTSLCMLVGIVVMTFVKSNDTSVMFAVWAAFFGVFGLGVGGEYPLSASGAAEHHVKRQLEDEECNDEERELARKKDITANAARRGETISIIFAMQGVGAVAGSLVLMCLLYFSEQGYVNCNSPAANEQGNNVQALEAVWRSFYFIGTILVIMMLTYRFFFAEESTAFQKVQERKKQRESRLGSHSMCKILGFYAPTLVGTAGCWFLWDIAFYGLKLFSGPIFGRLDPTGDLMTVNLYILLNNVVALVGYYCAALVIDKKSIGRKKLQMTSLLMTGLLYVACGATLPTAPAWVLLVLMLLASFTGNFGANVTTYVMAAESYPTELRSTCHGLSAFAGKTGALLATIVFG